MAHYFDAQPETPADERRIEFTYREKSFVFYSSAGVFSKNHLDEGSRALLDGACEYFSGLAEPLTGTLLDLGCGYGVLGIVLKRFFPKLTLVLADINQRALDLALRNTRENRIGHTEVLAVDAWEGLAERRFDFVVTNPPIRAGKQTVYAFFAGASQQLVNGGLFITVVAKQQGADSAKKELLRLFGNCEVIHRSKGFQVFCCEKRAEKADESEKNG